MSDFVNQTTAPLYVSHKKVRALRIIDVVKINASITDASFKVRLEDGTEADLPREMTTRYVPQIDDYLVRYEDGYESISPAKAFIDGYTRVD